MMRVLGFNLKESFASSSHSFSITFDTLFSLFLGTFKPIFHALFVKVPSQCLKHSVENSYYEQRKKHFSIKSFVNHPIASIHLNLGPTFIDTLAPPKNVFCENSF